MPENVRKRNRPAGRSNQGATSRRELTNHKESEDEEVGAATDEATEAQKDTAAPDSCSLMEAKLRLVMLMTIAGIKQKEIAKRFKVDPRTVYNWQKRAYEIELGIFEALDPKKEFERILVRLQSSEVQLHKISEDALARGDYIVAIRSQKELANLAIQRGKLVDQLGGFNGLNLSQSGQDDPSQQQAEMLFGMIEEAFAGITDAERDGSQEAE